MKSIECGRLHSFGRDRTRAYLRYAGKIIRILIITSYKGNDFQHPTIFMKRSSSTRMARGFHFCHGKYSSHYAAWFTQLIPGVWYREDADSGELTPVRTGTSGRLIQKIEEAA